MSTPGIVLIKGAAGLGNRMLAVLSGAAYAQITGRLSAVDWRDGLFAPENSNAFDLLFKSSGNVQADSISDNDSVSPSIWRGKVSLSANSLVHSLWPHLLGEYSTAKMTSIDISRLDYPEKVLVFWCWDDQIRLMRKHFKGPFRPLRRKSTFEIQRELARQYLIPRPELRQQIDAFKVEHWSQDVIGVHIRYTDLKVPLQRFYGAVDRLVPLNSSRKIFLATDNEAVQEEFRKRYANLIIRPKYFRGDGKPLHLNPNDGDVTQRAREALIELYLLSECHHLVCARWSTFSYMAQVLSNLPRERIIDFDRYNPLFHGKKWAQRHNIAVPAIARVARRLYRRATPSR